MACRQCVTGALHEGTPIGREETVHGLPTYIAEPPSDQSPTAIIVFIPDAFGWTFNNNRILADKYAKKTSCRVYLPDFMDGHMMDTSLFASMDTLLGNGWMVGKIMPLAHAIFEFIPFLYRNRLAVCKPRIYNFFHALRTSEGSSLPVGAAGFCWGGQYVFLLCSDSEKAANGKSLIDCGFAAHPSNASIPAYANAVGLPLSIIIGDVDIAMPIGQVEMTKKILEAKDKERHEVVVIPGAVHGFAIRAKPDDEKAMEHGAKAEEQAVAWFQRWLGKKGR